MSWQSVGFHQTASLGHSLHELAASDGLDRRSEESGTRAGLTLFRLTRAETEMMDRSLLDSHNLFPSLIHGSCCMSTASSAGAVLHTVDCITT